jgi:hypothetical protein
MKLPYPILYYPRRQRAPRITVRILVGFVAGYGLFHLLQLL